MLGGDGLIGLALGAALRAKGRTVTSLDLQSGVDLRKPFDIAPFEKCDRVWFLAWDTGGAKYLEARNQQHEQYKNNCEISLRVFDALARTGKPFLFATSQLAGLPNAYGTTKLMAWHWTLNLGGKVAWDSCRDATIAYTVARFNVPALRDFYFAKISRQKPKPDALANQ